METIGKPKALDLPEAKKKQNPHPKDRKVLSGKMLKVIGLLLGLVQVQDCSLRFLIWVFAVCKEELLR